MEFKTIRVTSLTLLIMGTFIVKFTVITKNANTPVVCVSV